MSICYVDLIDACHLKCPTCVRGTRLLPNTSRKISGEQFERIILKAKSEGYDSIGLYNWTEPFLNPNIANFIAMVKGIGLRCDVSSTLSFSKRLSLIEQSLRAGLDTLIVSISGSRQDVHQINHRGGNLALVRDNLSYVSRLMRQERIQTTVLLRFLRFTHNVDDEPLLRNYAQSLGFSFEAIDGVGYPNNPVSNYSGPDVYLERLRNFTSATRHEQDGKICPLIMDTVSIDADGQVFICCAYPNYRFLEIGPYLEMSKDEILLKRYTHPICSSCSFPRRKVTEDDREALIGALKARLGGTTQHVQIRPPEQQTQLTAGLIRKFRSWLDIGRRKG